MNEIITIRNQQVILDKDLARLYGVSTKRLNEQVKRNIERFPKDFMFQLTKNEKDKLVAFCDHLKYSSQLSYVFTEQGVAMLSGVLRSKKAIDVNIKLMRAFISMRKQLPIVDRLSIVENKLLDHDDKINEILDKLTVNLPEKGIFYDGQIFDAYNFVNDLIRSAEKEIKLIDNYVDDTTLTILTKRKKGIKVTIYTRITKELKKDIEKHNAQYEQINIKEFNKSHDRFLIIDNTTYHIGASLKDLGKKWFAFSKMDFIL